MSATRDIRKRWAQSGGLQAQVQRQIKGVNGVAVFVCFVLMIISILIAVPMGVGNVHWAWIVGEILILNLLGVYVLIAFKVADQWEKAIVLRLGRFVGLKGPGPFWIVPIVDTVPAWVDHRVMVTAFTAERTLTKDTVPVDVDAVLFWVVWDAEKAALEVEDYRAAISWAAQTALREIIGKMDLSDILVGREKMDTELQRIIDERTTPWGVTVQSVDQAQAERERQARVILGESEEQIADSFAKASEAYHDNPTALHLRAMNMLFEGLQERGAMVIVPSSAVDTMNLGGVMGLTAMAGMTPQFVPSKDSDEG